MKMSPFCRLKDPKTYVACDWDMRTDHPARQHWGEFFKRHIEILLSHGISADLARGKSSADVNRRADACRVEFHSIFDEFMANPHTRERVTILTFDGWRDGTLRKHGFADPFIDVKTRENTAALELLAEVCRKHDELSGKAHVREIVEGVFAGNIFDMGAQETAKRFAHSGPDFFKVIEDLPHRPWLVDDFDRLESALLQKRYNKLVYFIDNAGSDFILGALPFMRYLAMRGTKVVLAANEYPTLNDMTIHDVHAWWDRILAAEPSFRGLPITPVSTGTAEPLIDLSLVSEELNDASAEADLVVIEGQGRGVESNLDAEFACDTLNIAMLKDIAAARRLGGKMFDVVCRFR